MVTALQSSESVDATSTLQCGARLTLVSLGARKCAFESLAAPQDKTRSKRGHAECVELSIWGHSVTQPSPSELSVVLTNRRVYAYPWVVSSEP